ncbi:MAG: outer membrane lipoprotein LolB [Gammaproteobacteria bacterium]|nr:outer membrane lipoprotein LolB [Gammaproteobacteria bacterium]
MFTPFRWQPLYGLLLLLLSGCSTLAPQSDSSSLASAALWAQNRPVLEAIQHWSLEGRVAVHGDSDSAHFSLVWAQSPDAYQMTLIAPLGRGTATLTGDASSVEMLLSDGSVARSTTADALLAENYGWQVPVEGMKHWVLGLPAQGETKRLLLDKRGRLKYLEQAGWAIKFRQYQTFNGRSLPKKLYLKQGDWEVRLVIDHWSFEDGRTPLEKKT